ncbi:DEAD/DEAH box helicase [Bacillus altitudinis]|uniref:DEAD/DEAH box helicase n=2 Tax=Bacillus TaxID=1386 RepID=UPI0024A850A2|nr:DEAD/DEAH box helicase [Bacillus altitudinis]WHF26350.1 DEAD/DEAH box helicase [Bacillus altitudinis]
MNWEDINIYNINNLNFQDSFSLAKYVSNLSLSDKKNEARKILIHILEIWDYVNNDTKDIWLDIAESHGFYPYIKDRLDITSEIRQAYHYSENIENIVFHKEQKILSNYLKRKENIVVSAPTSFGKSLLIEEIVASNKHRNILIIQPTLALINETRLKLKKYKNYNMIVNTSQKIEGKNLFILTAERVLEFKNFPKIDYCILDEFYKISSTRDDERSDVLNIALKKILSNKETAFYFIGPNIDSISSGFEENYNAKFVKTDYSLVDTRVELVKVDFKSNKSRLKEKDRKIKLFEMLFKKKKEQSIVYVSSPDRAIKIAMEYYDYLEEKELLEKQSVLPINEWISENINPSWSYNKLLLQRIGVHSGTIPKHLTHSIIEYFNKKNLDVLFCTSTIIEGVNTSAKNVFIFDNRKGSNEIDYFDFSNIRGRAGRLLKHYSGNVYVFHSIPKKAKVELDMPFYDQEKISDEILINFNKSEVKAKNIERYEELTSYDERLLSIIKKNAVSVSGQKKIIESILTTLRSNPELILWTGEPSFKAVKYITDICWDNLLKETETTRPMTKKKLPVVVYNSLRSKSVKESLNKEYKYLKDQFTKLTKQQLIDKAISNYFREQRHWISYKVPKWLEVVDSLQKEICKINGVSKSGDYSYVASQLENEGVEGDFSVLLDMGVPSSAINKIKNQFSKGIDIKELISEAKNIADSSNTNLIEYEKEKLNEL